MKKQSALCVLAAVTLTAQADAAMIPIKKGCNLTRAIVAANTDRRVGTCRAGRVADTIRLRRNSLIVPRTPRRTPEGPSAYPMIVGQLRIVGSNSTVIRAPNAPPFRIFTVGPGSSLTIQHLTIRGGKTGAFSNGSAIYVGGVRSEDNPPNYEQGFSRLTLRASTVSGNVGGSTIDGHYTGFKVINSTISGNQGDGVGVF